LIVKLDLQKSRAWQLCCLPRFCKSWFLQPGLADLVTHKPAAVWRESCHLPAAMPRRAATSCSAKAGTRAETDRAEAESAADDPRHVAAGRRMGADGSVSPGWTGGKLGLI